VTFNEWIRSKGIEKVSVSLGVPVATTYSWMRRRAIPRSVWPDIVLKFAELGINDLMEMERASEAEK